MAPAYRVARNLTSRIAEVSEGASLSECLLAVKRDHADQVKDVMRAHADKLQGLNRDFKDALKKARDGYKKSVSPAEIKKQEKQRKEQVRSSRKAAEYDIYKELMGRLAVAGMSLKEAHKRAAEYAEHIIDHSPAGHQDVGWVR